jgi:hypothetical protein
MPPRRIVFDRDGRVRSPCGRRPAQGTVDVVVSMRSTRSIEYPPIDTDRLSLISQIRLLRVAYLDLGRRSCWTPLSSARRSGCVGRPSRDG